MKKCELPHNRMIRWMVKHGFITVISRFCPGCRDRIPSKTLRWLLENWVHMTHCRFCGEPVRIDVQPYHSMGGHGCWKLRLTYPECSEITRSDSSTVGGIISIVHDKCWNKAKEMKCST